MIARPEATAPELGACPTVRSSAAPAPRNAAGDFENAPALLHVTDSSSPCAPSPPPLATPSERAPMTGEDAGAHEDPPSTLVNRASGKPSARARPPSPTATSKTRAGGGEGAGCQPAASSQRSSLPSYVVASTVDP